MPFVKGQPKIGGRKEGTPNKSNKSVRDLVEAILGTSMPEQLLLLAGNDKRLKWNAIVTLLPYAYPKQSSVITTVQDNREDQEKADDAWVDKMLKLNNIVLDGSGVDTYSGVGVSNSPSNGSGVLGSGESPNESNSQTPSPH